MQEFSEKLEKNQREKNREKNEKRDEIEKEREWFVWLELERWEGPCFHKKTIFILMYKKGCLVSKYNNLTLPSVFQSLLHEFEDYLKMKYRKDYLPLEALNIK